MNLMNDYILKNYYNLLKKYLNEIFFLIKFVFILKKIFL